MYVQVGSTLAGKWEKSHIFSDTIREGVESFEVDLKEQKVTVKGNVQPDAVLQTVSKTGKKTAFWDAPAEPGAKPAETVAAA
ncbi:hypothetical protein V6N12_001460 [Hibiscus sabdariffa]|uniref:HMA domain-containing protein n=1 Tax=Hibiscus sabdariffa TaxID=183260 RepID=A0ABR2BQN0_9ROSI